MFTRRILHFGADSTTLLGVLSDTEAADPRAMRIEFELNRIGGCGSGTIELKDPFTDRGAIQTGHYLALEYDDGDRWYFGRVESVEHDSPKGVRIATYGRWSEMSEVFPGGFADANIGKPHRYQRSDYFPHDPDYSLHSVDAISGPDDVVALLFSQYIEPAIPTLTLSANEAPDPGVEVESFLFRGEESMAEILTATAMFSKNASVGIDEHSNLFFQQKRSPVLATFQEGVDLEKLSQHTDRSLLFNRILLTGGYVYTGEGFDSGGQVGFWRYRGVWKQFSSAELHGERAIQIFLPWIRNDDDAYQFAREFFRVYAKPTTRYEIATTPQGTLLKPWQGQIKLLAADGSALTTQEFEIIRVKFDRVPTFEITVGPSDINFPAPGHVEPQRFEIVGANNPGGSVSSLPTFTGVSQS